MLIKDRAEKMTEASDIHSGKGPCKAYTFFQKDIEAPMFFLDFVMEPGTYVGYHTHEGNEEIYYVVSGEGEYVQEGERKMIGPGDATLVKTGQSHGLKNTGSEELRILVFCAALKDGQMGAKDIGLADFIQDWGE